MSARIIRHGEHVAARANSIEAPLIPLGPGITAANQEAGVVAALAVGADRRLQVAWVGGESWWHVPVSFGDPFAPPGAGVALAKQRDLAFGADQLTALAVGDDRRLHVAWVVNPGPWNGPVGFGAAFAPPGAAVALARQSDDVLTGLVVGDDRRFHVAWVVGTQAWNGPVGFGAAFAPPGAGVALAKQSANQLTAVSVGDDGRFHVAWVVGNQGWQGPVAFGAPFATPGASVALVRQADDVLTAIAIGTDGRFHVAWVVGNQPWQGPVGFGESFAPSGAGVAMTKQNDDQVTAMAIGNDGRMHVAWVVGNQGWQGPAGFGAAFAAPGTGVTLVRQSPDLLTALAIGRDGRDHVAWARGVQPWEGPVPIVASPITGLIAKATLPETSPINPALASSRGRLFLAWKGDGNDNLNVAYSIDHGRTFMSKYVSGDTTPTAPALCGHDGRLYLAWKGDGNDHLNVAAVDVADTLGATPTGLSQKVTLGDTSSVGPAIASLDGRLYLAWKGSGNDHLNVMCSTDHGRTFFNKHTSAETSSHAPALCVHRGKLFIAWKGSGNHHLNVARVALDGDAISGLTDKVVLADTSPVAPTLASYMSLLYLGWTGEGGHNLNLLCSLDDGRTFGGKYTSPESSSAAPVLCGHAKQLVIGWKGNGNDALNVARVEQQLDLVTGTAKPKYQVLSLVYAPPGNNGGKTSSSVSYGAGSTLGTSASISESFKAGVTATASGTLGVFNASADFSYSTTTTDLSSIDIKRSQSLTATYSGPAKDGIDHDQDVFYLCLNPLLSVTIDPENNLLWDMGVDGPVMLYQVVKVRELKDPSLMAPGLKRLLDNAGLTTADYAAILALNPFASGATTIDGERYLPIGNTFPYEPPGSPTETVPAQTYNLQNTVTHASSHASSVQYGVGVTASVGVEKAWSVKVSGSLQWTNTATIGSSDASTQTATVTVGGPAMGYAGPTDVIVYWDSIYNVFMFAFASDAPVLRGRAHDPRGRVLAHVDVVLTAGGRQFTTTTDALGEYRFYDAPWGPGELLIAGHSTSTQIVPPVPRRR